MKFLLLAVIVVIFVAWLMRGRIRDSVTVSREHKELLTRALDPVLVGRILFHLSAGNKLAAISELRRVSGLQEAAAEWLVDAIRKGHRPPADTVSNPPADGFRPGTGRGPSVVPGEASVVNEERLGDQTS